MPARSPSRAAEATGTSTLDHVADELYGLAPAEFTAARTHHEKEARQAGDGELAAAIHRLAKPTIAAWLANQLVRERRDELATLPALGASLGQATEQLAGDELRQLSRQQHKLVYALVQQARQLARATGRAVSEDTSRALEDTLHAALADEHAAEQLLAGRLTEPLQRGGFGEWPATGARTPVRKVPAPAPPRRPRLDEELRRATQDLAEAERALTRVTKARDRARDQAAEANRTAEAARDQVEQLRQQLGEAAAAAAEADRHHHQQAAALRQAERAVSDAVRRQTDAQERRDRRAGGG